MRIAVLGAGAMGSLFGGYLSQRHEVWLIDTDPDRADAIRTGGVTIQEKDGVRVFYPEARTEASGVAPADLILVFVKAMHTRRALEQNRRLIADTAFVISLQNGAGHEDILREFVPVRRLVLGTTQHNASLQAPGRVRHGGGGMTHLGLLHPDDADLEPVARAFRYCGIDTLVTADIRKRIWEKLFLNASASALTAVLQVPLGFIAEDPHAWTLATRLIREAVSVANAAGRDFDAGQVAADIRRVLLEAREGITSICADLRDGIPTEVESISGFIVREASRLGMPAQGHETIAAIIHALEAKNAGGL